MEVAVSSAVVTDCAWATGAIVEVAQSRAGGRIVSSLEGGYDLEGLGQSALERKLSGGAIFNDIGRRQRLSRSQPNSQTRGAP